MRFEVLGPLVVRCQESLVRVGGPRERRALAALLLEQGRPVSPARLEEVLWVADPPATAKAQLHNCLAALRRALGPQIRITRSDGGFTLELADHELDLAEFGAWVAEADGLTDPAAAAQRYRAALGLWRGPALDGLADGALAAAAQRLQDQRLASLERCLGTELQLGRHAQLTDELAALVNEHPLRETLVELQMRTLCRAGRRAEALAAYAAARKRLTEELGVDPCPRLQRLHTAILRDREVPADGQPPTPAGLVSPSQLPAVTRHFVGRTGELDRLEKLASETNHSCAAVIPLVTGTAGVGKTTLALHWAQRVAHRFPDGQIYIDLRGFDPGDSPMPPTEAVRRVLDAFAVPSERIPVNPDAQAGLYRSLLAGRRVLLVLDNVRDADQVRPLLPGSATCLVVVTSRHQLTDLVVAAGAHPIALAPLTADEAHSLLRRQLGDERIAEVGRATVAALADRCAHLPLALAVAAARAAVNPVLPLSVLVGELADEHVRLDALDAGSPATSLRAVFSSSYQALSAPAQRMFRLLGVHCGPDISIRAAASLAGATPAQVRSRLAELVRAHLVTEDQPGRFGFHNLLRAYAAELATASGVEDEQQEAVHRTLDHYLHTARGADLLLHPGRTFPPAAARPGVTPEDLTGHQQALDWFRAERPVLLASIRQAAEHGFDHHIGQLVPASRLALSRLGYWQDWLAVEHAALAAAERLSDLPGQGAAHHGLGCAYTRLGQYPEAERHFRQAVDGFARVDDPTGQAGAYLKAAELFDLQGRMEDALHHAQRALSRYRAAGHRLGQARARNSIGWFHARLGNHQRALDSCQRALHTLDELGDRNGLAETWDSLGFIHHGRHEYRRAVDCYQHAAELFRQLGDRYNEAATLTRLGDAQLAAGDPGAARIGWQQALAILDELSHKDADRVRARLRPREIVLTGQA